jgi:chorismate dehydratase
MAMSGKKKSCIIPSRLDTHLARRYRIAAQGHLYARPLISGLEESSEVSLSVISPPSLADMLLCGDLDAALLPSVDLQAGGGLTVIPAGCVSASGGTFVTRIFSRVRPAQVSTLWVDAEAHTSVVLAQVLWSNLFNTRLDILPYDPPDRGAPDDVEAVLLVGDKVITAPPLGFDWQIDPTQMWFEMTGLPFVFAVWAAADAADAPELYRILLSAGVRGSCNLDQIAQEHAMLHDWPADLASRYVNKHLQFEFADSQKEGMEEFFHLAVECGAMDEFPQLRYYKPPV